MNLDNILIFLYFTHRTLGIPLAAGETPESLFKAIDTNHGGVV